MITGAEQWGYIIAAYGISAVVVAALIAWVVLQAQAQAATLAKLNARGARRRSER